MRNLNKQPHAPTNLETVYNQSDDGDPEIDFEDDNGIKIDRTHTIIMRNQTMMMRCNPSLVLVHRSTVDSFCLLIPYYILSTPSLEPKASFLIIIMLSLRNLGAVFGSQIVPILSLCSSNKKANLFIAHSLQFICGISGWILVTPMFSDLHLAFFIFSAFILGIAGDATNVQSYGSIIGRGNIDIQVLLMTNIGKIRIISSIISYFALAPIFDFAGFTYFCIVCVGLNCCGLFVLFILWHFIRKTAAIDTYSETPNETELINATNEEADDDDLNQQIPLYSSLTLPMWLFVFVMFSNGLSTELFAVGFPILYQREWNISSSVAGILQGAALPFSYISLTLMCKFMNRSTLLKYPYNVMMPLILYLIGNLMYVIVQRPFMAFIFHWMIRSYQPVGFGLCMVLRVHLCPEPAFSTVTRITMFLVSCSYLLASGVTSPLAQVNIYAPFVVGIITNIITASVILITYFYRNTFLSKLKNDDIDEREEDVVYLNCERNYYARIIDSYRMPSMHRQTAVDIVEYTHWMQDTIAQLNTADLVGRLSLLTTSYAFNDRTPMRMRNATMVQQVIEEE